MRKKTVNKKFKVSFVTDDQESVDVETALKKLKLQLTVFATFKQRRPKNKKWSKIDVDKFLDDYFLFRLAELTGVKEIVKSNYSVRVSR